MLLLKKYFPNILIYLFVLLVVFVDSGQSQDKVGTSAAPFLGISVGPRATAMGGTFVAICDDASSIYWNPAGISFMRESQAAVSHSEWLIGTGFNWAGVVLNIGADNALGFSFTQLDYGEEEVIDELNQDGTGQRWSAMDLSVALSYARNMTDRFSIGGSVKWIQQKIWNESANALAVDVGLIFVTQFNDMRLGMSISNFGSDMRFDGKDLQRRIDLDPLANGNNETITSLLKTDAWPLPLFYRVGLAYDFLRSERMKITGAVDAIRPSDNNSIFNVGSEVAFYDLLFLRGGYKSLFRESSEEGLTLGVGLKYKMGSSGRINIDFAYADFGLLDNVKYYSIGYTF
jgi:hypothetical protein